LRRRDGMVITCELSASLVDANGATMILLAPIDVTRQREAEHDIRELNVGLEQRVAARTLGLEQSNAELGAALGALKSAQHELLRSEKMAALGSLVAGVAHELNTPLGNSITVASTLQEHAREARAILSKAQPSRSALEASIAASITGTDILMRTLDRAAELVHSFKQVAVDQASNHRRHFDLRGVLEEVLVTLAPMYKKTPHRLQLDLADGLGMDSYPGAFAQVLTNLISNALAHAFDAKRGGTMLLRVRAHGPDQVELDFSDDGAGIAPELIERVFDPFYTTRLGQGGSGLGMHITYNLVNDLLGGTIELHSTVGSGTQLHLVVPRVAPYAPKH
jgi:signal transduction histidine kinase